MRKIRVAFLASTLDLGGAENVIAELVTRLPRERFDVELFLLKRAGTVGARLLSSGVRGRERLAKHRSDPAVVPRLLREFRRFGPDLLFVLDHHDAMFWGGLCAQAAGVPRRVAASHATGRMGGRPSFGLLDRLFLGAADRVIALSGSHAEYLRKVESIEGSRITVIENGVDVARYGRTSPAAPAFLRRSLGLENGVPVVLMVAALRPEKAHEALLEAARLLIEDGRSWKFLIAGDGPRREELEGTSRRLGLGSRVVFLGERGDVPDLLHVASVLVLPSHAAVETLPLCVLEAMAAGVPVVASAVGSIPDVIENGVNGRLIGPADAVGLREALCHIIDHSQETAEMTRRARETVRARYSVERMVSRYAELFETLCQTKA